MKLSTLDRTDAPGSTAPGVVLGLFATAQLMLVLDVTVVNVALPAIGADLHLSRGSVPWVLTVYTLCFGGLMLFGGRLADRVGARRMTLIGLVGFTASSGLCSSAGGAGALLTGRALQGIAAALLSPAALAAALTAFPGPQRRRAMAVWAGLAGAGSALGVILGGVLTSAGSWRWVFAINVPIGVGLLVAITLVVPDAPPARSARRPLDLAGAILVTAATAGLIDGLISASTAGWGSPRAWAPMVAATVLLGGFVARERTVSDPLLHPELFTRRPVVAGAFLMLVATGLLVGAFFLGSFALQHAHDDSALRTGLAFLPTAVATVAGAQLSGQLLGHVSARIVAPVGFALCALGYAAAALFDGTAALVAGLSVAAAGAGSLFVTAFTAALGDVDQDEAGLRSALINTFHELGGAAGVAVLSGAAGTALVALHPAAEDFSPAFALGAIVAALGGVAAVFVVPPVLRLLDPATPCH